MAAFPAAQNKAGLVGLPFHFREAIAIIVVIFDWSDWGTKRTMQKIRCRMPAA